MMNVLKTLLGVAVLGLFVQSGVAADDYSTHDRLKIAVQQICPVMGEKLGAHGPPIKVRIGEEDIFLCCKGCMKGPINPTHWATIHTNFRTSQKICPVMKHELSAKAKWTFVKGQIVYVCCPPCTDKIAAAPDAYLKKIDELYTASLRSRQTQR